MRLTDDAQTCSSYNVFLTTIYLATLFFLISCDAPITDPNTGTEPDISESVFSDIISQAQLRRIDFLLIGDSNTVFGGSGWDHGIQHALANNFQMYATGLISAKENYGHGAGAGYFYASGDRADASTYGAPLELNNYMDGSLMPQNYGYLSTGQFTQGHGLFTAAPADADPLDILHSDIRYHYCYGSFPSGDGQFRPGIRNESTPYDSITQSDWVQTNTGQYGVHWGNLDTGGNQISKISGRFADTETTNGAQAPYLAYFSRMEIPERTAGFSVSTMFYQGGASLYDMAYAFNHAHDKTIWLNLYEARRLQESVNQIPKIIIVVNSGVNDRNEAETSLGPGKYTDGDSAEAYVDNLKSLISRVEDVWKANFSDGELYWLIAPSHPLDQPNEELKTYRSAVKLFADTRFNIHVIDMAEFVNPGVASAQNWYAGEGGNSVHLTQLGYESMATMLLQSLTEE